MGWREVWQVMAKHCGWYLRRRSIFNFRPSILSPWQLVPSRSERLLGPLMSLYRVHGGANGSIWYQTLTRRVAICHRKGPTLALLLTPFNPFLPIRLNLHCSSYIRTMFSKHLIKSDLQYPSSLLRPNHYPEHILTMSRRTNDSVDRLAAGLRRSLHSGPDAKDTAALPN